jgi:hypothetical protein
LWREAVARLLADSRLAQPDQLPTIINNAVSPLDLHVTIYLVDHEQVTLRAVPEPGRELAQPLTIKATLGGRAFMTVEPVVGTGAEGRQRLWMPLVDGTERLGVLGVHSRAAPVAAAEFQTQCGMLAALIGHLVAVKSAYGDLFVRARRTRRMSVASELLWRLVPPLTFACDRFVVSTILEPSYDVGGDGFDYAVDASVATLAILDTSGHGLPAGLGTAVVLSALRAARRDGADLSTMVRAADAALVEQFSDLRFTTGIVAQLDLDSGVLRYLNAGHPPPLLIRSGRVVRRLDGGRLMPIGLGDQPVDVGQEMLQHGDRLLCYTDGFVEARDIDGRMFGEDRLVDLAARSANEGLPAPETLRRLSHAVLGHLDGPPRDDATLMLVEWSSAAALRAAP